MIRDAIILGAGAAGLMCAVSASGQKKSVLLLEANTRPGLKILVSGGGRCNFTNLNVTPNDYVSQNPHFCKSALSQFTQNDFVHLVERAGIEYYEKTPGQLFCRTSSREILRLLLDRLDPKYCELKIGLQIVGVKKNGGLFCVTGNGQKFFAKNLIVATGGLSFPKLGASDLGYRIAKQFDHPITTLSPALDGFVFADTEKYIFRNLSGISVEATLTTGKKSFLENILFTHHGISGPAALKASLYWSPEQSVIVDFLPRIPDILKWIEKLLKTENKKIVENCLAGFFVTRLADKIAELSRTTGKRMADLSKTDITSLQRILKQYRFAPASTVGYDKAEVTRGGVDTKNLSSKTMESKLVPGLYFVGEVVDVTGLLGGYNFQWAWSSGWVAGQAMSPTNFSY